MNDAIEIAVGDVNDVEAHVYAIFPASSTAGGYSDDRIEISGTLRGPFCDAARTLPAEYSFRPVTEHGLDASQAVAPHANQVVAEVIVTDPCLWSPDLPHVYHVDVEVRQVGRVLATFHGQVGLRRTAPRREGIAFPG
jgi:hypothetical protein